MEGNKFHQLGLSKEVLKAIDDMGFDNLQVYKQK